MKKNIIRFIIFLLIAILPFWAFYKWKQQQYASLIKSKINTYHNAAYIYAGGSSFSFAIDDSLNFSDLSEPYLFTLKKIELLKPKTVVLSVGVNYFMKHYDDCYNDGILTKYAYQFLSKTLTPQEKSDLNELTSFETKAFTACHTYIPFLGSKLGTEDKNRILGGYFYSGKIHDLSTFRLRQRVQQIFPYGKIQYSDHQKKYFNKIISYCSRHHIKLILMAIPVSKQLIAQYPEGTLNSYHHFIMQSIMGAKVKHVDFHQLTMPDSCFYDGDHLNERGLQYIRHKTTLSAFHQ